MLGILCPVVAVIVFVFAEGLRRWYSGFFFVVPGVALLHALPWRRAS